MHALLKNYLNVWVHRQAAIEVVHGMDNGIWKLVSLCDLVEYVLGFVVNKTIIKHEGHFIQHAFCRGDKVSRSVTYTFQSWQLQVGYTLWSVTYTFQSWQLQVGCTLGVLPIPFRVGSCRLGILLSIASHRHLYDFILARL